MHTDVLDQYYTLTEESPPEVKTGGMDLYDPAIIGLLWWDPDGYWGASQWRERGVWRLEAHDPFDVALPDGTDFSMGVSQFEEP